LASIDRGGKERLRALIPEGLRWFTEADISIARDVELLELMRDARCQQVLIGLESPRDALQHGFVELVRQLYCEAETNRRRRGFRQLVRQSETARRCVERCAV